MTSKAYDMLNDSVTSSDFYFPCSCFKYSVSNLRLCVELTMGADDKPATGTSCNVVTLKQKKKASKYRAHRKLFSIPLGLNGTKVRPLRLTPKQSYEVCRWCYPCWKCCISCQLLGGNYHMNYGRPAGLQQCWSAVCPACKRGYSTPLCSPAAIIYCINEWVSLLDTESHRTAAYWKTWIHTENM